MTDMTTGLQGAAKSSSPSSGAAQRVCDTCRARKIRCDKEHPCSHCVNNKIICTYNDPKLREKRTRILLTPQYEKKIDRLDSRLDAVLELLRDLKYDQKIQASSNSTSPHPIQQTKATDEVPSSISTPSSHNVQSGTTEVPVVEGDSSMAAHSAFATQFVQQVAGPDSPQVSEPEMREALAALSNVVTTLNEKTVGSEMIYPHARPSPRPALSGFELPPIQKVVALIRIARTQRLTGTGWIYEFLCFRNFSDICLNVYFAEDYSETDLITVNAGLYSMFGDYCTQLSSPERETNLEYAHMCRANLETALHNLPLHLPATSDVIVSLIFGAWHAIELSKPTLSWTLSSKASELCQTLGYQRITSTRNDQDTQFKKFLFWSTYFLDKCLSLRLGRPSTIPDWDILTPRPSIDDPHKQAVMAYFVQWIESARCQGNIYEMLYSPDSLRQSDHVRKTRVQSLIFDLQILDQKTEEIHKRWIQTAKEESGEDLMDFFAISDHIQRLSLLTLVYRASPPEPGSLATFSVNCVDAARATLERHQDCLRVINKNSSVYLPKYVHWTLLFTPFIPFIVIFCHVIETQDQVDLNRLNDFVVSIQAAAAGSDAAARLYHLLQALQKVALRYIELSNLHQGQAQASAEMEMYLSTFGITIPGATNGDPQNQGSLAQGLSNVMRCGGLDTAGLNGGQTVINPFMRTGNGANLEDWFYSNEAMMDLLQDSEQDFQGHS